MPRHGLGEPDTVPFSLSGTRTTTRGTSRFSPRSTPGTILVAAVAAGAVLPAVQTLSTAHVADAEAPQAPDPASTTAALSLASQHRAAGVAGHSSSVSPIAMPATSTGSARHAASSSDDEPSAGDASDVSSMLKSIEYERENGPLEFGRPYEAGNERTLDGQIAKALGLMGLPQRLAPGVKKIIMRESTGNADAVNDWDSNAASGTPSKGLMQLIDTTFRNAVLPELADRGIFDPVANITAGVRTMIANHSIDDVLAGGLRNSSGNYIGYGGAAIPDDGLGRAS